MTLETMTIAIWQSYLNEMFAIESAPERMLEIELIKITAYSHNNPASRESYALEFAGPLQPLLPQKIYSVRHERMEQMDIFLVPIATRADRVIYEAIFG